MRELSMYFGVVYFTFLVLDILGDSWICGFIALIKFVNFSVAISSNTCHFINVSCFNSSTIYLRAFFFLVYYFVSFWIVSMLSLSLLIFHFTMLNVLLSLSSVFFISDTGVCISSSIWAFKKPFQCSSISLLPWTCKT